MTNELEKKFFDTFGIEPKKYCKRCCWCKIEETTFGDYDMCLKPENGNCLCVYPQITDSILLELICILNIATVPDLGDINTGRLKNTILEECVNALSKVDWENRTPTKEEFINEIQALFEEG